MKRFVTCLLALVLLASTLLFTVSCGGEENQDTVNLGEISTGADGLRYDENGYLMDDLPEDLNYGGREVNILTCEEMSYAVCPTEINNTALNDASYTRNKIIEGRLGVKLNFVLQTGIPTAVGIYEEFSAKVTNAVSAGTGDYDLVCAFSLGPADWALKGYCLDLNDVEYLDFEKPWWSYSVLENEFYDTVFYAMTNCSGTMLDELIVTYYNRDILAANNINDPEQLALDGKWTLDKLYQYSKNLYADKNNNGGKDLQDSFGLVFYKVVYTDSFFYGAGLNTARINAGTGLPELTLNNTTEMSKALEVIKGIIAGLDGTDVILGQNANESGLDCMKENRTAFYISYIKHTKEIPDTKVWGVIPTPKYNEEQENYITTPNNDFDAWCILKDANDPDMSGAIMEAYASGCYRTVAPAYYDESLSYRYSNNENGVTIFNMIKQNVKIDVGRINSFAIGVIDEIIRQSYRDQYNSFYREYMMNYKSYQKKLDKVIESYKNHEG